MNGVNTEAMQSLVVMEAVSDFPMEVLIFMIGEDGEKTEEVLEIVYPPPKCDRYKTFGHWDCQCKERQRWGGMNGRSSKCQGHKQWECVWSEGEEKGG